MVNSFSDKIEFRKAAEQVWHTHSAQILRLCERKCANIEEARDLFQTVALKFCENLDILMRRNDAKPWLLAVMHHSFLDIVADRRRTCLMSAVAESSPEYMAFSEEESLFYTRATSSELRLAMAKMLKILTPVERMILEMKYFGGFSIKELSAILAISQNAVRKRRSFAFKKIRQFYEENNLASKIMP